MLVQQLDVRIADAVQTRSQAEQEKHDGEEELEDELMSSDMGHSAVSDLIQSLRTHLVGARVNRKAQLADVVENALRGALLSLLKAGYWNFDDTIRELVAEESPVVVMMVGVNGTGKTTTSAKIAKRLDDQGFGVVLAAADTFRAGAIDQLTALKILSKVIY